MNKAKILLVEDNQDLSFLVSTALNKDGHDVIACERGVDAICAVKDHAFDVILLDLMLPDIKGLELVDILRDYSDAHIIIVSAKSQLTEKITGLEAGADDYLAKPFELDELLARVKAHARRKNNTGHETTGKKVRFGQWIMDLKKFKVQNIDGMPVNLTINEFNLLKTMVTNPGRVFTREQLLLQSRRDTPEITDRAIDTQIARIRKKMTPLSESECPIQSIRGLGYTYQGAIEVVTH